VSTATARGPEKSPEIYLKRYDALIIGFAAVILSNMKK
jgi:hypothetical protein